MTSSELIERALREIQPAPTPEQALHLRTFLEVRIKSALRILAEKAMTGNLLRKTFSVTAVLGEASLATPLAASEPLILEGLRRSSVYIDDFDYPAQYKADRSSLSFPATTELAYWALENQTILIRDAVGIDNYAGTVEIKNAPYIPLLTSVPVSLETVLVMIVAEMVPANKAAA